MVESSEERDFVKNAYLTSDQVTDGVLTADSMWTGCYNGGDEATEGNWECLSSTSTWSVDGGKTGYWGMCF